MCFSQSDRPRGRPHTWSARRLITLVPVGAALLVGLGACGDGVGAPCGRAQQATARATLPDTGINAGRELQVVFIQHDPDLAGELSEIAIQTPYPAATVFDPEPDPRVRLLRGDGRVLLDTLATRFDQPRNVYDRPTWVVLQWIRGAERRNAVFEALRDQTLWLELWRADATQPGTRVRLRTETALVTPPAVCM
jgi:hypothetical protein